MWRKAKSDVAAKVIGCDFLIQSWTIFGGNHNKLKFRKNVSGINREFAQTTDQSCLNRFLTDANWDVEQFNQRRLDWLQEEPSTRYSAQGVIPIDNTLIDHHGEMIQDAGWF